MIFLYFDWLVWNCVGLEIGFKIFCVIIRNVKGKIWVIEDVIYWGIDGILKDFCGKYYLVVEFYEVVILVIWLWLKSFKLKRNS